MRKGVDYGQIPGTPKPGLWKAGAELLRIWANLSVEMLVSAKTEETNPTAPFFFYTIETRLYGRNGLVGTGFGSCNSREARYAFRWIYENQLPSTLDKSTLQTRNSYGRTQYRAPTPPEQIFELANTVLKMAQKRSFVAAILEVTGASRIFTQDTVEDIEPVQPTSAAKTSQQSPPRTPAKPATQSTPPSQPPWTDTSQ